MSGLKTDLEKVKVVTKYELLKQYRRKRFYGVLAITIIAILLTVGLYKGLEIPGHMQESIIGPQVDNFATQLPENLPTEMRENLVSEFRENVIAQLELAGIGDNPDFFATWITAMGSLAVIGAVFFAGDSIAGEFENKTGYILFPNPVKRTVLVVGKYLANFIATATILVIGYLISATALLGFYGQIPGGMLASLGMALTLTCAVISIAFTFSSVLKGGMGATIATFLVFMLISPIVSTALAYTGHEPWYMPDRAMDAIAAPYGVSFEEFTAGMLGGAGGMAGSMARASKDVGRNFLAMSGYAVLLFFVSLWLARHREMI